MVNLGLCNPPIASSGLGIDSFPVRFLSTLPVLLVIVLLTADIVTLWLVPFLSRFSTELFRLETVF